MPVPTTSSAVRPQTWVGLAALLLLGVAGKGCSYWREQKQQSARADLAGPYLEAFNAERQRVGLWPISPLLTKRTFQDSSALLWDTIRLQAKGNKRRYTPYLHSKTLAYAFPGLQWETENIVLTPWRLTSQGYAEYVLNRTYSFTAAQQGRDPWSIALSTRRGESAEQQPLTHAQADSVLAYWKQQGQRDSLATVSVVSRP